MPVSDGSDAGDRMRSRQDQNGSYAPTGRAQRSDFYVPTAPMVSVLDRAIQTANFTRTTATTNHFHFAGEGAGFANAGVPCIAYIVAPNYLMTKAKGGEVHRLNKDRMYAEIQTFARCLEQLDNMSHEDAYKGMEALAAASPKDRVVNGDATVKESRRYT